MNTTSKYPFISLGLMLFALFFGAGNLIFPPLLGQEAGTNIWSATFGFIITGVGLPLLAVIATAINGGDFGNILRRIHPKFAVIFFILLYLAIGPLFGIPRTGNVAFELSLDPILQGNDINHSLLLFIFTIIYFILSFWLALNPTKLVDRIGKYITPVILTILILVFILQLVNPIGELESPSVKYLQSPIISGFLEGYLTLDALAALIFGTVIASMILQGKKSAQHDRVKSITIKAALVASIGLVGIYSILAYLGASSTSLGEFTNGGQYLAAIVKYQAGTMGQILLGVGVTLACLTTSVGLLTACSQFFSKILPISYKITLILLTLFSLVVSNVGLSKLIEISIPILLMLYPITIVLILLSLLDPYLKQVPQVYVGAVIGAGLVSIYDGLNTIGLNTKSIEPLYSWLPFINEGAGWIVPALIGAVVGLGIGLLGNHNHN